MLCLSSSSPSLNPREEEVAVMGSLENVMFFLYSGDMVDRNLTPTGKYERLEGSWPDVLTLE